MVSVNASSLQLAILIQWTPVQPFRSRMPPQVYTRQIPSQKVLRGPTAIPAAAPKGSEESPTGIMKTES